MTKQVNFRPEVKKVTSKSNGNIEVLLVVSNASLKGKYESLNEFLGKTVSTTIEPETVEYKVPVNKQTNKPNVEYVVNNDGTVEVLKEEQTSLEMGDDVQEVEEVAVQVSKETIDEFIKKATTIEWPESVMINVRGVLHRIDEGEALEEIAADHDVSVDNLINQVSDHVDVPAFKTLPISVTGITLDKTELALKVGETATLTPTIMPENATNKAYRFSSEDAAIGTVTPVQGKVTAVAEGVTKIVGTTEDGNFTAECTLTVSAAE